MELRSTVFEHFSCFPGHLERIIAKVLGCYAVRIQGVLGCGSFNLVLEALLYEARGDERHRRVAIRLPLTGKPRAVTQQQVTSGYAATLFMSSLSLPTAVAEPVHVAADSPLPYATRGRCHLTVMPVLDGASAWTLWDGATLAWKKTVVAEVATLVLQLYRHPLDGFGSMALSADGVPCVGPLQNGAVAVAIQRGVDVGGLNPGPYLTWKEFAWNHIQGLVLLFGECPLYGQHIKADSKLVLRWLEKFEPRSEKFYLVHPDFKTPHILADASSGHVRSIVDWDCARTGTVQDLVSSFFPCAGYDEYDYNYDYEDDEELDEEDKEAKQKRKKVEDENEELTAVYVDQLRQGGAPELVQYMIEDLDHTDPQTIFENEFCPALGLIKGLNPRGAHSCLRYFCATMGLTRHSLLLQPPWKRFDPASSSTESDEPFFTSHSSSSSSSSSSSDELDKEASPLVDANSPLLLIAKT